MSFQKDRNLPPDGICDAPTWMALVEAAWSLGDRLLYLTSPNLRGDDVAELQTRLSRIGFDCGKVDGIFGLLAAEAVAQFQANCGLAQDGVFGQETLRSLERVSRQTGSGPGVATVRERDSMRRSNDKTTMARVAIGLFTEQPHLARLIARGLRNKQVRVITITSPDTRDHALSANKTGRL